MKRSLILILTHLILLTACMPAVQPKITLPEPAVAVVQITAAPTPTQTPKPTLTATFNPLRAVAPTLTPSATPDPYAEMYIEALAGRQYGGGVLEDLGALNSTSGAFSRRLFRYRSEGLQMYGFLNIPSGAGSFPVIIMLHGHVEPEQYTTLDYSTRYADALAEQGYVVLHPNLRGYPPSPGAENRLGIGDTIDTLNLLALVRQFAGVEGLLEKADAERIGLWGHSMGGGIVLRMLIIDRDIKAALLYASISADETLNLSHFDKDGRGMEKIFAPEETINLLSPFNYLERITAPLSIHHGEADDVVPLEWSIDLCKKLKSLDKITECWNYERQPHTFQNSGDTQLIARTSAFFNAQLKQ